MKLIFFRNPAVALFVLLFAACAHAAAPFGDADPTFNSVSIPGAQCDHRIAASGDGTMYVGIFLPYQDHGFGVAKFLKDGSLDQGWGAGGKVEFPRTPYNDLFMAAGFLPLPDGGLIVVGGRQLLRIAPNGTIDTTYGTNGFSDVLGDNVALQSDGAVVVLFDGFVRVLPDGRIDRLFGENGKLALSIGPDEALYGWSVLSNGSVEYGTYKRGADPRVELRLHRTPEFVSNFDPAFSSNGRIVPKTGLGGWVSPNLQVGPGGAVLFTTWACTGSSCDTPVATVSRFLASGAPDSTFGAGGRTLINPFSSRLFRTTVVPRMLSITPEGSMTVIVYGEQSIGGFPAPSYLDAGDRAYRLLANGNLDPVFDNGRKLPSGQFTKYLQLDDGRLVATGQGACIQRLTADMYRMNVPVAEFYHPALDQYFITAEGLESGLLDGQQGPARWNRTGYVFGGWLGVGMPGAARVCRFYGDKAAGPNSHFYTLEGEECDSLKALEAATPLGSPAWRFEGYGFSAGRPVNGSCPANLSPVYRAYNRGFEQGKVPNHRYTADLRVYESMLAKGWAGEGLKYCMPPVSSNVSTF